MAQTKSASAVEEDRFLASEIATATHFTAHFRAGPFEKYTEQHPSYELARLAADRLQTEHSRFGRRALVYAVTPRGDSIPCTAELIALSRAL
jgi:hypothetical protein